MRELQLLWFQSYYPIYRWKICSKIIYGSFLAILIIILFETFLSLLFFITVWTWLSTTKTKVWQTILDVKSFDILFHYGSKILVILKNQFTFAPAAVNITNPTYNPTCSTADFTFSNLSKLKVGTVLNIMRTHWVIKQHWGCIVWRKGVSTTTRVSIRHFFTRWLVAGFAYTCSLQNCWVKEGRPSL